jgi:hypothetical protein
MNPNVPLPVFESQEHRYRTSADAYLAWLGVRPSQEMKDQLFERFVDLLKLSDLPSQEQAARMKTFQSCLRDDRIFVAVRCCISLAALAQKSQRTSSRPSWPANAPDTADGFKTQASHIALSRPETPVAKRLKLDAGASFAKPIEISDESDDAHAGSSGIEVRKHTNEDWWYDLEREPWRTYEALLAEERALDQRSTSFSSHPRR